MAMNCSVSPLGKLGAAGVTSMDCSTAEVTVRVMLAVEPDKCADRCAEIVALPALRAEIFPGVPPAPLTVATALLEDDHVT